MKRSLFFIIISICSCSSILFTYRLYGQQTSEHFIVETKSLEADTVITSAIYFGERILCLQANHQFFVLDTLLNKDSTLTAKFSNIKADFLQSLNDTIFISTGNGLYFLDKYFTLQHYNQQPFTYGLPYYNDTTYYVHACSAGEFGAAVFFRYRKTNTTYAYPTIGVEQVLKFEDTYVVSNVMYRGLSNYLFIKDPSKLHRLKNVMPHIHCEWFRPSDSTRNLELFDVADLSGIRYIYTDTAPTKTLVTFINKNKLYSIYCTDSTTMLSKFEDTAFITVDTLLHHELVFQRVKTHLVNDIAVTAYKATWAASDNISTMKNYQNTGLIFIRNNKITFLKFQIPHI